MQNSFVHAARRRSHAPLCGLVALSLSAWLVGCGSTPNPDHLARFWLQGDEVMTLRVEGDRPLVQIEPDIGPLQRIEWLRTDGTTTFPGVPVGGDFVLTLSDGDRLVLGPGRGSMVEVTLWNTRHYALTNGRDTATTAARIE